MWQYTELVYILSSLYYTQEEILALVIRAEIKPQFLRFNSKAVIFWTNIIEYAEQKEKVNDIIMVVLKDGHETNEYFLHFLIDNATRFKSPYSNRNVQAIDIPNSQTLEKLTSKVDTILPISFLEMGISKSKSVVRILTSGSMGTGFVIKNGYIITNNHVINSVTEAQSARIQFNYQTSITGQLLKFKEFSLDPTPEHGFFTSEINDWTVVKIKDYNDHRIQLYGYLDLVEVNINKMENVNIIQHSGGEHKKIALYHNIVLDVSDTKLQYLTDTLPGSSGSPVFNSQWNVVGLHHASIYRKSVIVNQGININAIISDLRVHNLVI